MQQVADWLQNIGLEQYAQAFAENDIDFVVLAELTDQDLEKIGVTSLGHRRKLLRAIVELKGSPEPSSVAAAPVAPRDTAERRQVTVMFSDLVGSTALSARMDPEDLREVITAYQKCVAEIVDRFGGFVAKYMGDGVLIYFGYPQALNQFDDAWRCIDQAVMAIRATKESWCEAQVYRTAGEIALTSPEPDETKAESYFQRALVVARAQRAKSFELRAAMSMAQLWRDQGQRKQAYDLLAPVYNWFTEGFDTLDLKEAKAFLGELA